MRNGQTAIKQSKNKSSSKKIKSYISVSMKTPLTRFCDIHGE